MARIGQAIFVVGPKAVGKSQFIDDWHAGRLPVRIARLLPTIGEGWASRHAKSVARMVEAGDEGWPHRIVVHYDTLRCLMYGGSYDKDPALRLIANADEVTLIVVEASPSVLARRLAARHWRRTNGTKSGQPVGRIAPVMWALNRISAVGPEHWALRRSRRLSERWNAFKQDLKRWNWNALQIYLKAPDRVQAMTDDCIATIAALGTKDIRVLRVQPGVGRTFAWPVANQSVLPRRSFDQLAPVARVPERSPFPS